MRKRNSLKTVGATTLAAATVASGLTFGLSPASATSGEGSPVNPRVLQPLSLIFKDSSNYIGHADHYWGYQGSLEGARANASDRPIYFNTSMQVISNRDGSRCLTLLSRESRWVLNMDSCSTASKFKIENGQLIALQSPGLRVNGFVKSSTPTLGYVYMGGGPQLPWIDGPSDPGQPGENGGFKADGLNYSTSMDAGTTRLIQAGAQTTSRISSLSGRISFSAPKGLRLTPGQTSIAARYYDGSSWHYDPRLDVKGTVSADGSTFTGQIANTAVSSSGTSFSWWVSVTADPSASTTTAKVETEASGSTNLGTYNFTDRTTVTINGVENPAKPVTARVVRQDDDARTALIAGTATPGATIVGPGGAEATVSSGGAWNMEVSDLSIGKNTLTFTQFIGGSQQGSTSVDVTIGERVENGGFSAVGTGTPATIDAGDTKPVHFGANVTDAVTAMNGTQVSVTAPNGTTFPEGTTSLSGQYAKDGTWHDSASLTVNGSLSSDRKTFTGTMADTSPTFNLPTGNSVRWSADVEVPADASAATSNMGFSVNGTSNHGSFNLSGNSPVTVTAAAENGGVNATGVGYAYSMAAGTKATVQSGFRINRDLSTIEGSIGLQAPAGTTITAGTTTIVGKYNDGDAWIADPRLDLVGTVSSDGRTFSGNFDATIDAPQYRIIAWSVPVTAAPSTTDTTGTLDMNARGATNLGSFTVTDKTKITVKGVEAVAPTARVVSQDDEDRTALIAGTGQPGAQIVGPLGAETLVSENGTWNLQVTALELGKNTVEFTQMIDGRPSGKVSVDVTIKDNAPKPTTAKVDSVDDAARTAKVSGTATKGSEIRVGNTVIATADSDGNWSGTVSGLEVGTQDVTFAQYINGTKVNDTTIPITVKKAEVAPLEVLTPKNGATVDSSRPVFSGTGDVGATIEVRGSSRVVATATVDGDGKWSVPAGFDLADGTYNLTVKQTATSGDASTKTVTFTIKDTAGHVDLTAKGAFDADVSKPATISGAATAGATVIVRDTFGNEIARTIATSNKTYSVAIPAGKAQFGVNEFSVTQTVKGQVSAPEKVSLDYGTPTPVDITSPENGATVDKKDLTFTGTGQSGAKVDIRGMVNAIATGTVADGKWTAKVNYTLSNNVYNLWAVQTTKGGMTTRQAITVTVTDQAVAPLTATAAFNTTDANLPATVVGTAQNGATVTVKTSTGTVIGTATVVAGKYTVAVDPKHADFGINTFTITQTVNGKESAPLNRTLDYGNPVAPAITTPANGATVTAGKVTFTGTGDTGSKVDMRGMVSAVGTGKVVNGSWTVETRELSANVYKLFAVQTSKGGLTKQVETTITLQDKKVTELTAVGTFDAENDKDATISGNAENGATVVVKEGSTVIKTVTAVNGKYSVAIPAVGSGVRTFAVTQTVDGTVSPAKSASLDYGTVIPVAVTSPSNGDKIKAGTITFTGTGTPGALVKVGGTVSQLGSAKVNAQGDWSLTLDRQLSPQVYTLFVKQTTKGNLVGDAVERTFTVVK